MDSGRQKGQIFKELYKVITVSFRTGLRLVLRIKIKLRN